ncbi:LysR family transcriptional regulator [Pseudomonas protegens]|uniref:LysR family transcriptional regulator n=1 Tax=Pseudomonas protegens TaxID=380021 RepID=UPI000E1ED7FE|nr:LysR family transcriptional regulator [Pseudomonas protegens]AXK52391.1 LysR family transcriptional regulator [Pseudomonas protegens]
MSHIDLNLIRTFVTLYEARSVTLAAERLFVTQPSVSYALARLRDLFDDGLFSRSRDGIQPSQLADELYPPLRESLTRIENTVHSTRHFDPATTERRFRIALSDLGEMGFLPLILARLNQQAPEAEVEVLPLQVDQAGEWLGSAKVDALICRKPLTGTRSQVLIRERYVCLLSDRHPRIGEHLSLEQFLAERHIAVTRTTGHGSVEDVLKQMNATRRISLQVPHFSVLPKVLPGTDLLAVLPAQIARLFTLEGGLRQLELPFPLGEFDVSLHWHPNSDSSAALTWFRQTVAAAIIDGQA